MGRDRARVLWKVALADWVVAVLSEVAYYPWCGELIHVPGPLSTYFWEVDLPWFGRLAGFTPTLVQDALLAIRDADWSRAASQPD